MKRITITVVALFSFAASAHAQTSTLECVYRSYSNGSAIKSDDRLTLTFLVDQRQGKAYVLGNAGSTEVTLVPSESGPTFIEITGAGNVMTTAVSTKGASAHSRGTRVSGDLLATQYYGSCTKK